MAHTSGSLPGMIRPPKLATYQYLTVPSQSIESDAQVTTMAIFCRAIIGESRMLTHEDQIVLDFAFPNTAARRLFMKYLAHHGYPYEEI